MIWHICLNVQEAGNESRAVTVGKNYRVKQVISSVHEKSDRSDLQSLRKLLLLAKFLSFKTQMTS